jgi:excisionase family DNA binding protein
MEISKNQQQSQPAGPRFESELLSRKEAAAYLGIAEQTLAIWHCAKRYDLPCAKIGRLVRYRKSDLDSFIARNMRNVEKTSRLQ